MRKTAILTTSFIALAVAIASLSRAQARDLQMLAQLAPPPLPQPAAQYFYNDNGKPAGPVSLSEIQARIAAGAIKPDTLVWKAGTPNWVQAREQAEIATLFVTPPPTPTPTPVVVPQPAPTPTPAATPLAGDCKGKVLLSDDFRAVDDSWGGDPSSDAVTIENGKVKIKANPSSGYTVLYGGMLFDDADICVVAQVPNQMTKPAAASAGPVFWGQDYNNFYTFNIAPDGRAGIVRRLKGRWVDVVPYRKAAGINGNPGDKNILRVTTTGNGITAYINGNRFASVKGQAPQGGGQVGLHAESEEGRRDTWKFIGFKVTEAAD
jgi:GYF domain 2